MKKLILYILVLFSLTQLNAQQTDSSVVYYKMGLNAFNKMKFVVADSLFSRSIRKHEHPDAYFNRAACRQKTGNKNGYCEDICSAAVLGDKKAQEIYLKGCGTLDTSYIKTEINPDKTEFPNKIIFYKSEFENAYMVSRYDKNDKLLKSFHAKKGDKRLPPPEVFTLVEEQAEFPGDMMAMMKYVAANLVYPTELREAGISSKVFIKFIVNENGTLSNIEILKSIPECEACNAEAIRVLRSMPNWKPARIKGNAVNYYFTLPVTFKMQ